MANDDRQSEQFIREVDEEFRREQLKNLWQRFAPLILGVCVLVVLVTAGYRGWEWWHQRQAAQAGDRFLAALEAVESGDEAKGEEALAAIAAEGDAGYAVLARLRLAGERAAAGQKEEAIALFDAVAGDASLSPPLRDLARMRAALLALDTGDVAAAGDRAEPLNRAGNRWRHAAREVIGMAAYQSGDLETARERFIEIQQDAETPPDLWARAGMMIALIDGQLPATTAAGAGGPSVGAPDAPPSPEAQAAPQPLTTIPPQ